jgi:predicted ATP-dependent serine protease
MFCNNCGKEVKDDASFCNHCGGLIKQVQAARVEQKMLKSKKTLLFAIVAALLVIIGAGVSAFMLGRGSAPSNNAGQSTEAEPRPERAPSSTPMPTQTPISPANLFITEDEAIRTATAFIEAFDEIVGGGLEDQYANIWAYETIIAWKTLLMDIGTYNGIKSATAYVGTDEAIVIIEVFGANTNAVVETTIYNDNTISPRVIFSIIN